MPDPIEVKYRFAHDKAAAAELLRVQDRIDKAFDEQVKAAKRAGDAYTDVEKAALRASIAAEEMAQSQIRAARATAEIYGDVASRTSALAGLASGLGGGVLGERLMLAADVLDAVEAMKLMRAELPAMTANLVSAVGGMGNLALVGGAAAAAGVALALAVDDMNKRFEEGRKQAQLYIASLDAEFEARYGMTREETEAAKAAAEEQLAIATQHLARLTEAQDKAWREQVVDATWTLGPFGEALARVQAAVTGTEAEEYADDIERVRETITNLQGTIEGYDRVLEENATVVQDVETQLAEAEQELIDAAREAHQIELERARLLRTGTVKSIEDEIAARQESVAALDNEIDMLLDEGVMTESLLARVNELLDVRDREIEKLDFLQNEALGMAEAREREAEALEVAKDALEVVNESRLTYAQYLLDAERAEASFAGKRLAYIEETDAKIADKERTYQQKRDKQVDDFERGQAQKWQDHLASLEAMEDEYHDTVADLHAEYEADELKRLRDFQRERERADEDHHDRVADAAARLDAIAVMDEIRQHTKDERRAQEDFDAETRQREAEFQAQLRQEQQAFAERYRQAEQAYQRQAERERANFDRQLRQQDAAHRATITKMQQEAQDKLRQMDAAHQGEMARLQQAAADKIATLNGWYTSEEQLLHQHLVNMRDRWQSILNPAQQVQARMQSTASAIRNLMGRFLGSRQAGGYLPDTGMFAGHKGEYVLPAPAVRALERGIGQPLTPSAVAAAADHSRSVQVGQIVLGDIGGFSPQQVEGMIERGLIRALEGMA